MSESEESEIVREVAEQAPPANPIHGVQTESATHASLYSSY